MNGSAFKLATFAKPGGGSFAAIVLDDTAIDLAAAQTAYRASARKGALSSADSIQGLLEDWDANFAVLQDIDDRPGFGAFWGEVQSTLHLALGVQGCVTNGSFRDVEALATGFQIIGGGVRPSHAHVHMVQMCCEVNVFGMLVKHDDVIHADVHGAVVIPADAVKALPDAIAVIARREKVILDAARTPGFNKVKLREALKRASEIH